MKIFQSLTCAVLSGALVLQGCATAPVADSVPGKIQVTYSTSFGDGTRLKDVPEEVTIVRRETTGKAVAAQVGLMLISLLGAGGAGFQGVSKESLKGEVIEDVTDRANLRNPVSTAFVEKLQVAVDEFVAKDPAQQARLYRHPLVVGGGSAKLVYDQLAGEAEPLFQLYFDMDVHKKRESSMFKPARTIRCSDKSQPAKKLAEWAEADYRSVRVELDKMLEACHQVTMAHLADLLHD